MSARVIAFDMNETTLDLAPVRAVVDEHLADAGGFTVWFQKLLQLSMATTVTGEFLPFGTLAKHSFDAVADTQATTPPADAFAAVATAIGSIQPYAEVPAGLERLRDGGWTTIALTNSGQDMVEGQCRNAGLADLFDHIVSVEQVQVYKPWPTPYLHAATVAGIEPADLWMVACHDWDLAGARNAGLKTAFIERPHMSYADSYPAADLRVANFMRLADELL
jgi:2-haloacid dehalogenase